MSCLVVRTLSLDIVVCYRVQSSGCIAFVRNIRVLSNLLWPNFAGPSSRLATIW